MIWHVHVYEMRAKGEVELEAETKKEALEKALAMTKAGDVAMDQDPETPHMAMAFQGPRNHLEPDRPVPGGSDGSTEAGSDG